MGINPTSTASRAVELNKASIGQEIMLKSLNKNANAQAQQAKPQHSVPKAQPNKPGHIDTYV